MPGLVLDGSAALAAVLPTEQSPHALAILDRVAAESALVPVIWPTEVANGLLQAERRGRLTEEFRLRRLGDFSRLPVVVDFDSHHLAWSDTSRLAAQHELTVYDASYLELALRLRLPLATLDKALAAAASRERVPVL